MEFLNFLEIDDHMRKTALCIEISRQEGLATAMYADICNTLGCYAPKLEVSLFGLIKPIEDKYRGKGVLTRPGMYYSPSTIKVALVDTYIAAYDHGISLGIHDMDIMYKAELAHTLIHELSHSMQDTYEDEALVAAMEWANEQNVWNNLYPVLAPMMKKKYKIKLYEETVDDGCGRVFSYTYRTLTSYEVIISFLVNHAFPPSNSKNTKIRQIIANAQNVSVILSFNGNKIPEDMRAIKTNGSLNLRNIDLVRNFLMSVPVTFEYDFDLSYSVDMNNVELLCGIYPSLYEPLYRPDSPDWE